MKKLKSTNKFCGVCGSDIFLWLLDEHEELYCPKCNCIWRKKNDDVMPTNNKPVSKEEFDNLLIACLKTPPLRLKDLKAKLKKEQEERKQKTTS